MSLKARIFSATNLEARFFSPEEFDAERDMDKHRCPFEQRMTPADILRPEDDTYPVSSDSTTDGIFTILQISPFLSFLVLDMMLVHLFYVRALRGSIFYFGPFATRLTQFGVRLSQFALFFNNVARFNVPTALGQVQCT